MANILIGGVNLKTLGMHNGIANAKDYGALANDTYDNSGVVQAIIDAWEALDGGTIVFPASQEGARYRFTTGVINDSINVVSFSGTGSSPQQYITGGNASVLWLDSATDDAYLIKYGVGGVASGGQIIERLTFMGRSSSAGVNQSGVLYAAHSKNNAMRNCGFQYFTGYAVAHDPTTGVYIQNASMHNTHFWNVGGCFGPATEYVPAANYLFATGYTFSNIGLDGGMYVGATPKPFIWDFRATRSVVFNGFFLIEGNGVAGQTAAIALASGDAKFEQIHYEIGSNDPTYFIALYGVAGGYFNASGEKTLEIGNTGTNAGVPIWIEDDATNECVINIGTFGCYDADSIADIFEWENGIGVNLSGSINIGTLGTKNTIRIPDNYFGRLTVGTFGSDHQSRVVKNQRARRLFSWNPSMGSILRHWGQVEIFNASSNATTAIETDGVHLCQRFTSNATNDFPSLVFRVFGDNYEGATVHIMIRGRATINAADAGLGWGRLTGTGLSQVELIDGIDAGGKWANSTIYETVSGSAMLMDGTVDPNRYFQTIKIGTFTVAPVHRLLSVEIWLGTPENSDLATVGAPVVPTFTASDTTPSVSGFKTWKTNTGALTITNLDDFPAGEERTIISKGAIVFDTTGTNLVGSSVDITTASGDITRWVSEDGTTKRLVGVDRTTGNVLTAASVTGGAGIRVPHGTAPSSPVDGDMWTTTAGLYIRINGSTVGPLT